MTWLFLWQAIYTTLRDTIKKPPADKISFINRWYFFGADNRTRTCMVSHWNLNPACLPIPPCPRLSIIIEQTRQLVITSLCIYVKANLLSGAHS